LLAATYVPCIDSGTGVVKGQWPGGLGVHHLAIKVDFDNVIELFASRKARKVLFSEVCYAYVYQEQKSSV